MAGALRERGFTVLEAVVAMTVLALAAGACLQLRAQALAQARSIQREHELARTAHAIFELATAGELGPAERLDPDDPRSPLLWTGDRYGASYRLVREVVLVENPVRVATSSSGAATTYPEMVAVRRYDLALDGERFVLEWTR
jgi:Tfp pilus assembly protein PilV